MGQKIPQPRVHGTGNRSSNDADPIADGNGDLRLGSMMHEPTKHRVRSCIGSTLSQHLKGREPPINERPTSNMTVFHQPSEDHHDLRNNDHNEGQARATGGGPIAGARAETSAPKPDPSYQFAGT